MRGRVNVLSPDGKLRSAKKGMRFTVGETITTGKKSLAILKLSDSSILKVEPNSKLIIEALIDRKKRGYSGVSSFVLATGGLMVDVVKQFAGPHSLKIKTKTVALGVRGTHFYSFIDHKSNDFWTTVKEGNVEALDYKNDDYEVVSKGRSLVFLKGKKLTKPMVYKWSRTIHWSRDKKSATGSKKNRRKLAKARRAELKKRMASALKRKKRKFKKKLRALQRKYRKKRKKPVKVLDRYINRLKLTLQIPPEAIKKLLSNKKIRKWIGLMLKQESNRTKLTRRKKRDYLNVYKEQLIKLAFQKHQGGKWPKMPAKLSDQDRFIIGELMEKASGLENRPSGRRKKVREKKAREKKVKFVDKSKDDLIKERSRKAKRGKLHKKCGYRFLPPSGYKSYEIIKFEYNKCTTFLAGMDVLICGATLVNKIAKACEYLKLKLSKANKTKKLTEKEIIAKYLEDNKEELKNCALKPLRLSEYKTLKIMQDQLKRYKDFRVGMNSRKCPSFRLKIIDKSIKFIQGKIDKEESKNSPSVKKVKDDMLKLCAGPISQGFPCKVSDKRCEEGYFQAAKKKDETTGHTIYACAKMEF